MAEEKTSTNTKRIDAENEEEVTDSVGGSLESGQDERDFDRVPTERSRYRVVSPTLLGRIGELILPLVRRIANKTGIRHTNFRSGYRIARGGLPAMDPKDYVYRYNNDPSTDELVSDYEGKLEVPSAGDTIQRLGKKWRVTKVFPDYRRAVLLYLIDLTDE
jgi:hypothetical protein